MTADGGELISCRAKTRAPGCDWDGVWTRARLPDLGSELMSFLFKVLHYLLPTQERLARTSPTVTGECIICKSNVREDLVHAFVSCPSNQGIGVAVLESLPPGNQVHGHVLKLQLALEVHVELPVVWFLAVSWCSIWESRRLGRRPELYKVRADLEAKVSLLRETRHSEAAEEITSLISNL